MKSFTRARFFFPFLLLLIAGLACQAVYRLPETIGLAESTSVETQGELLYSEDFSDNSRGWDIETSSDDFGNTTKKVVDGKYRISLASEMGYLFDITTIPGFSGADYLLSIDVSVITLRAAPGDFALQFSLREVDGVNGKHYAFEFDNEGSYYGEVWTSGSYKSAEYILDESQHQGLILAPGFSKTLAVKADGDTFTLYLEGEELARARDATISEAGQISLLLGLIGSDQSAVVEFDNLAIYALP
jgi:hypothetical protein